MKIAGRTGNEKGIALFLVLWVLTLLSVIVGEFCRTMRTEVNITRNFKEQTQAYYLAEAGVNAAIRELIKHIVMPREIKPSDQSQSPLSLTISGKRIRRSDGSLPRIRKMTKAFLRQ